MVDVGKEFFMQQSETYIALKLPADYQAEMLRRQAVAVAEGREYVVDNAEAQNLVDTLGAREPNQEAIAQFKFYQMLAEMPAEQALAVAEHYANLAEPQGGQNGLV